MQDLKRIERSVAENNENMLSAALGELRFVCFLTSDNDAHLTRACQWKSPGSTNTATWEILIPKVSFTTTWPCSVMLNVWLGYMFDLRKKGKTLKVNEKILKAADPIREHFVWYERHCVKSKSHLVDTHLNCFYSLDSPLSPMVVESYSFLFISILCWRLPPLLGAHN